MKKLRIYISGPITDNPNYSEDFAKAEEKLNIEATVGVVVNPAKVCSQLPDDFEHYEYMKICIPLLEMCDVIYLLPGWQKSKGCIIEKNIAESANKLVIRGDK